MNVYQMGRFRSWSCHGKYRPLISPFQIGRIPSQHGWQLRYPPRKVLACVSYSALYKLTTSRAPIPQHFPDTSPASFSTPSFIIKKTPCKKNLLYILTRCKVIRTYTFWDAGIQRVKMMGKKLGFLKGKITKGLNLSVLIPPIKYVLFVLSEYTMHYYFYLRHAQTQTRQ